MLNKNYYRLINVMIESQKDTITSKELAMLLDVSVKSVKNYVSLINYEQQLITPSSRGYKINKKDALKVIETESQAIPQNSKERINYILNHILSNHSNQPIDLYDLAEELMISYETIQHDFVSVKHLLSKYNLFVKISSSMVVLNGSERDKRKLFSKLIIDEFSENILSLDSLSRVFPKYDLAWLADMIHNTCKDYHYFINDYSLLSLLLEVTIGVERIRNKFELISRSDINKHGTREKQLAQTIAVKIEVKFNIKYSEDEIGELTSLLISYLMKLEPDNLNIENILNYVGSDCMEIVEELKTLMNEWDFIDTSNEEIIIRLALHIKNLLIRLKNGYVAFNPLTNQIRSTYPLIFECSVELAEKIKKITGYLVDNNEIAYLALHIGCMLGERNLIENKITCICLFPHYYDYSTKLIEEINNYFNDKMVISGIVTRYSEAETIKNYEILLTIVPISNHRDERILQISPFFNQKDKALISLKIDEINLMKYKNNLKYKLYKFVSPELFCKDMLFVNSKEALLFMVNKMAELGCVEESYLDDVMQREKEASTAYGRIAVPHSFNMDAKKSSIFVLVSSKGLKWGEGTVNIVLLFAINKNDRAFFYEIFDCLISNLLQVENVNKVILGSNLQEFISSLIDCIENNI
jgi:lichenan operon transcriptional antiterminator